MSDWWSTPEGRWALIFHGDGQHPHSLADWHRIAAAIDSTDAAWRPGRLRGDDQWCSTAADMFERLRDSPAYATPDPVGCVADPDVVRAWLLAPALAVDPRLTIMAAQGLDQPLDPRALAALVEQAHHVGVLATDGTRLMLAHKATTTGLTGEVTILAHHHSGQWLASDPIPVGVLTGGDLTFDPIARIQVALGQVAAHVNILLAAPGEPGRPPPSTIRDRPFPNLAAGLGLPAAAPPPTTTIIPRGSHR